MFLKEGHEDVDVGEVDHEIPHGYENVLEEMRANEIYNKLKKYVFYYYILVQN